MLKRISLFLAMLMMLTLTMGSAALADEQITVSGTATVQLEPDMVTVSMGVTFFHEDVLIAQQEANAVINQVVEALTSEKLAIPAEDIATTQYRIDENYEYSSIRGTSEKTGYNAVVMLGVCVRDLDKAGAVIDAAMKAGANELNGLTFMSSDQRDARDQALTLAVQDGMRKAKVIAAAAGIKIGAVPNTITENTVSAYNAYSNAVYTMAEMDSAAGATKLQAGMLSVTANVTLTYETDD